MRIARRSVVLVLVAALAGMGALGSDSDGADKAETYRTITLYAEALSVIHDQYVDELPWTKLVGDGIRGAVQGLDADGALLPRAPSKSPTEPAAPANGEVGLTVARRDDGLSVVAVRDGMPARSAGIWSGDRIVTLDGTDARGLAVMKAADRLRGRPGTEVTLTIIRSGWSEPRPFTLTRVKTPAFAVSDRSLSDGVLYVRMPMINDATASELKHLLESTPPEQPSGIVLDVRNAPGGNVQAARAVASLFLAPGCLVTWIDGRTSRQPLEVRAAGTTDPQTRPMAVLVDRGTASAAEVLVGALQDSGRAVIVGSKTFGDASAQSVIPLSDGSELSLTTARYLTPKRHAITGKGIAPDLVVNGPPPTAVRAAANGTGSSETDPQLDVAFQVVKAARILEHRPNAGDRSTRVEEPRGGCVPAPAHVQNG
jgi:carboxyl-terminal processing protease